MRKRLTALLLSFVMLLTMLPVTVSAEGAEETGGGRKPDRSQGTLPAGISPQRQHDRYRHCGVLHPARYDQAL